MLDIAETFKNGCRLAATQDDGIISKAEATQLKRIDRATDKFIKELNKIKSTP